jgi:hypothetical protein
MTMRAGGGGRLAKQVEGTLRLAWLHRVSCLGVYGDLFGRYVVGQRRRRLRTYVLRRSECQVAEGRATDRGGFAGG